MKMRKIILAISIIACMLPVNIIAAEPPLNSPEEKLKPLGIISFVPQYFFINGLRLDYDLAMNSNHWIQMAPVLFYRDSPSDGVFSTSRSNKQKGAGMHIYHRYYPAEGFSANKVYLAYGPMYHFNNLQYEDRSDTDNPEKFSSIHKTGFDILMGFNTLLSDNMIFDLYVGLGMRHSFIRSDAANPVKFNNSYIDFGYSGNILLMGLRIGFVTSARP